MTFRAFYSHKLTWLVEHLLFADMPVCLAVVTYSHNPVVHYSLMGLTAVYMSLIVWVLRTRLSDIGLSVSQFSSHVWQLLPGTLVICGIILTLKYIDIVHALPATQGVLWVYLFISVPLQEIVFRSLCVWRCSLSWKNPVFITVFTSLNFAFYHLFFHSSQLIIGVFLINLFWSYYYFKQKDVAATTLSHVLIGLAYFI